MSAQTAFLIFLGVVAVAVLVTRTRPATSDSDRAIITSIDAALSREFPLANLQVDVKSFDGVVILGGYTREMAQTRRVVEIARETPGVKSVDNRISIRTGD